MRHFSNMEEQIIFVLTESLGLTDFNHFEYLNFILELCRIVYVWNDYFYKLIYQIKVYDIWYKKIK